MKYLFLLLLFVNSCFFTHLFTKDTFEQIVYQKINKELNLKEILDEQLKTFGLEQTDANRLAFFSIIFKDLQANLQKNVNLKFKSFYGDNSLSNSNNGQTQEMLAYQTEMTRTLTALLQSVNSKINKSVGVKKKYVILAVILAFIASELGFFKKFIGMSHFYMENKEKVIKKLDAFGNWVKKKTEPVADVFVNTDKLSNKPGAKKFLDAWNRWESVIKDREDWHDDVILVAKRIIIQGDGQQVTLWVDPEDEKKEKDKMKRK
ncbi:MAG: hypothetical protein SZ59_C0001G0189 [candidate division TM6 bacterium GW2011_GWF2_28_16]|nr:MAG: hypothetical protein SZ59_C0001G0189 [candidate division TM6 bacterium GW2011_GWF2_28_16]